MAISDHSKSLIENSNMPLLEKAFNILCEKEVELEEKLKDIREAKARVMVQVDIKINKK